MHVANGSWEGSLAGGQKTEGVNVHVQTGRAGGLGCIAAMGMEKNDS